MGVAVRAVRRYRGFAHSQTPRGYGSSGSQPDESPTLDEHRGFNQEAHALVIVDVKKRHKLQKVRERDPVAMVKIAEGSFIRGSGMETGQAGNAPTGQTR